MNCPHCGAARESFEGWATGDWNVRYECGSTNDDNNDRWRSEECREREANQRKGA